MGPEPVIPASGSPAKPIAEGRADSNRGGDTVVAELTVINEWIPEQMEPGTIFILENAGEAGDPNDPYWAVLSCPSCATLGLVTRKQVNGLTPIICGSECCSASYFIRDEQVVERKAS